MIPAVKEEVDRIIGLCRDSTQGMQFIVRENQHSANSCSKGTL